VSTYLVFAITQLIGVRNFFKISRKLLSVGSFENYHEDITFSNSVITEHFLLLAVYLIRYSLYWINSNCRLYVLRCNMSDLVCDIVTCFVAIQFLYFVFTLHRHFMLLNSGLNDFVMSTVKSEYIVLKVRTV
jgi:hypothetical protein